MAGTPYAHEKSGISLLQDLASYQEGKEMEESVDYAVDQV
jgi:hypothetical protein